MDQPVTTFTAFRVFGVFKWPPVPPLLSGKDDDLLEAVVEIHCINTSSVATTDAPLRAVIRCLPWSKIPRGRVSTPFVILENAIGGIPYLHHLSATDLAKMFEREAFEDSSGVVIRLDEHADIVEVGERLFFRGAQILDQFRLTQDGNVTAERGDPKPELRWLLAAQYNSGVRSLFSEIVIGQKDDKPQTYGSTIRFNLALPTPIAQCVIENEPQYALPFSVTYTPIVTSSDSAPLAINKFSAGSSSFPTEWVDLKKMVADPRLGHFDFCGTQSKKKTGFLSFPKDIDDRGEYWLEDVGVFCKELLARFYKVDQGSYFALGGTSGTSEFGNSVQFIRGTNGPGAAGLEKRATRIVFRYSIESSVLLEKNDGDLNVRLGKFLIRNPDQPSQWISTNSSELPIEIDLRYDLASADIFRLGAEGAGEPKITVRFGFRDSPQIDVGNEKLDSDPEQPDRVRVADLFLDAIKGMRLARIDLQHLGGPQPQSVLPDIQLSGEKVRFALTCDVDASFDQHGHLRWRNQMARSAWSGAALKLSLWPSDRFIGVGRPKDEHEVNNLLEGTITLPSFAYETAAKSRISVVLAYDVAAPKGQSLEFCQFRIVSSDTTQGGKLTCRIGGIEFTTVGSHLFDDKGDEIQFYSHWRFGRRRPISDAADITRVYRTASFDFRLRFDIASVVPLGVDTSWGDRSGRSRPLLVPSAGAAGGGRFILDLRETLSESSDRRLTARLLDTGKADARREDNVYVVISEEPFTIVRFRSEALGNRGDQGNALVAAYDSDTRTWQFKLVGKDYHYEYPPQVIGESMDKPRRLEIVDLKPGEVGEPVVSDIEGLRKQRAVEFRLGPSAEIWIAPSDVARGYFLPEWASYEIFRQSGAYGLGAALVAFRGEFLYGLTVGVDVNRETGNSRGARIAEIEALTGRPPSIVEGSNTDSELTRRWAAVSRTIARRPERLEIWSRDLGKTDAFSPARFESGVAFALRNTAVHRPAVERAEPNKNEPKSGQPRSRQYGLSGGALWPVESANLYNKLIAAPVSDGGSIERIALSPHGGDADQKAEFLNHQVAIISETRNGSVQRHKVEVIGRIAVFWHRAKHVVVYERTVNPTAQFTPEDGIEAGAHTRRPVLRKVSEYIELLMPTRSYPDFPSATPASSGFLSSVRFNSKTINVDSAWSEDVGDYGWKIPLWNRDSARKRPQVYPRPDIGFVTRAEGEGNNPVGTQECLEPENVYFFADFEKGGNDTDSWQSRVGIDCSALPAPSHAWQPPLRDGDNSEGGSRQASALRVPRGHRRFTWRLAPAARKTALNAGRSDEPMFAGLDSITFMRSSPSDNRGFAAELEKGIVAANSIVAPADRFPLWGPGEAPPGAVLDLGTALGKFIDAANPDTGDPTKVRSAADELKIQLGNLRDKLIDPNSLKNYADVVEKSAADLGQLKSLLGEASGRCKKLADDLLGSIQRKQLLILENLGAWENDAYRLIPDPGPPQTVKALKDMLTASAVQAIRPALRDIGTDRLGLGSGLEATCAIIRDFESDVRAVESVSSAKLGEFRRVYDDGKPWSEGRLRSFLQKLETERNGILRDVHSAIADAQQRLATELDDLSRRVGAVASEAISQVGSGSLAQLEMLTRANAIFERVVNSAIEKIDTLFIKDKDGKDRFDLADESLAKLEGQAGKYQPRVAQLRQRVKDLKSDTDEARQKLDQLKGNFGSTIDDLWKVIEEAAQVAFATVRGFENFVSELIMIAGAAEYDGLGDFGKEATAFAEEVRIGIGSAATEFTSVGAMLDQIVSATELQTRETLQKEVFARINRVLALASDAGEALAGKVDQLEMALSGDNLITTVLIGPVLDRLFQGIDEKALNPYGQPEYDRLIGLITRFSGTAREELEALDERTIAEFKKGLFDACEQLGGGLGKALERLQKFGDGLRADAEVQIKALTGLSDEIINDAEALAKFARGLDHDIRTIGNDLASSYAATTGYAEKVFETVGNLGSGGIASAPNNILKLYAAVASAPELPNLGFARERMGYYYKTLNEVIDTTPVEAWFGRLGDELKALGLSFPFSKLGSRLLPDDLSSLDIGRVFKNFGGLKLDQLFKGYKLPKGASDAIKVTHAFDKKLFRAWVQIDVDVPIPDRRTLFSVGPFQLDFVDSRLIGQVRLEASKDGDKVEQTGRASVTTDIEAVVGGQTMVSLRKVVVRFERSSGLQVDFDPKNIKLNPTFQFIQETLGTLFPDEVGGLKLIKQNGIPVGVEHEFSMPPVDLMFGTSGVSNIQISNRFALVAYPDFVISNRFSLSKPELPFLFSIFVIGGTGYITVDTEYRPFGNELMVMVEAAAGGSAALGFAFGPVSGSVFITLSVALAYRKLIGTHGGGLTVSLVLLIAGNVNVAGIATVYIGLLLRMSYRDNGQIDANGTLTLTIRISRFFKIKVRANVQYKLRGGRSQTVTSVGADTEITDSKLKDAKDRASKLLEARG